jgi:methyl-accepting chemotaxis protein
VGGIETELDKFDDMRLLALVLQLRHHEKDFLLRRDPKYLDELKKTATEMAMAIRIATIPPKTKEVFTQKLDTYQRDFAAYVEGSQTVAAEQKSMVEAYNKVEPALEALDKSVESLNTEARAASDATRATISLRIQIALLTIILAVSVLSFLIGRSVSRPLAAMTVAMRKLGGGDFEVVLPGLGRKDEIGDIADAVEAFKVSAMEKAKGEADAVLRRQAAEAEQQARAAEERARSAAEQAAVVESLAQGLRSLSAGDLTFRLGDDFPAAYLQVRDDFNAAIDGLQETIASISGAAREVASAAAEISTGTTDLSQRTEEQAASLEQTSASMEQMSATVKKNAQNADQANAFTNSTRQVGDRAGQVVTEAVGAMSRIEQSSRKISDIISVIDEIARQTNLLALNAAVEAARAGEAGRGFAVVASEVRSLAQRSSQAAKDIKDLITGSSTQVKEGVDLVNRAGASLNEMIVSINKVSEIVSEIASASGEQSTGIDQINKALSQMDEVTQQNSALVEQNAASAKTLEQQSTAMHERVSYFQVDDGKAVVAPHVVAAPVQRPLAPVAKRDVAPPKAPVTPPRSLATPTRGPAAAKASTAPRTVAVPQRRPARVAQAALAAQIEDDWKEF